MNDLSAQGSPSLQVLTVSIYIVPSSSFTIPSDFDMSPAMWRTGQFNVINCTS